LEQAAVILVTILVWGWALAARHPAAIAVDKKSTPFPFDSDAHVTVITYPAALAGF
jgi:hypothetical protein